MVSDIPDNTETGDALSFNQKADAFIFRWAAKLPELPLWPLALMTVIAVILFFMAAATAIMSL